MKVLWLMGSSAAPFGYGFWAHGYRMELAGLDELVMPFGSLQRLLGRIAPYPSDPDMSYFWGQ